MPMIFSLTITINRSFYGSVIRILLWNEGYCMLLDFLAINNLTPVVDMTEQEGNGPIESAGNRAMNCYL